MRRMIVVAFGGPEVVELRTTEDRPPSRDRVRVRVTHASLGSTDALARRGGYLLQPRPGFCLLYTSPSPRDGLLSRMPSSA